MAYFMDYDWDKYVVNDYAVFDLETTGVYNSDEIVQFGALKVIDDEIVDSFDLMVNPKRHIRSNASNLNHITDEMVVDKIPINCGLADFLDFVADLPLIGFNSNSFDMRMLQNSAERHCHRQVLNKTIDVMVLLRGLTGYKNLSLEKAAEIYDIKNICAHNAISDAECTCELYKIAKNMIKSGRIYCGHNYQSIGEHIKTIVKNGHDGADVDVKIKPKKNGRDASIYMCGTVAFSIVLNNASRCIETICQEAAKFVSMIDGAEQKENGKIRFNITPDFYKSEYLQEMVNAVYDRYDYSLGKFGCCSHFIECSDAKKCIKDSSFARKCHYNDNLKNGIIFYGKNANYKLK